MSHEKTAKQLMDPLPSGKRPKRRPRTRWPYYVKDLAWSCLGIPQLAAGDSDARRSQLKLLLPQPPKKDKRTKENTLN